MPRLSLQAKERFLSLLRLQVDAGVTLSAALRQLRHGSGDTALNSVAETLLEKIDTGSPFHESCAAAGLLAPWELGLIRTAEQAGRLSAAFRAIEEHCRHWIQIRRKIITAAMYPFLLVNFAYLCFGITSLIQAPIQFLLGWLAFLCWQAGIVAAIACSRRMPAIREFQDRLVLECPGIRVVFRLPTLRAIQTVYFRSLAETLDAGTPIRTAARLTAETIGNTLVRRDYLQAADASEAGVPIADGFARCRYLDAAQHGMVHAGEVSGQLTSTLRKIADAARFDLDQWLYRFYKIFPVVLMLCIFIPLGILTVLNFPLS